MPSPLIGAAELAGSLADPRLRICDVRWYLADPDQGRREHAAGHLPRAVFVDLDGVLTADQGPGRHPLPTPARFAADMGALGIGPHDRVVAYDSAGGASAARLWWMLRAIGHADVRVLDGGIDAWTEAGGRLTTEVPPVTPVEYEVSDVSWPGVVAVDQVRQESATLVDARAPERYEGRHEPVDPRAGHIPGAVNIPHVGNLDATRRHLPPDVLAARFEGLGPEPIVYCGSGVTACADLLAMEVAGITDGRLYEGSWSDWSSRPELPAETS